MSAETAGASAATAAAGAGAGALGSVDSLARVEAMRLTSSLSCLSRAAFVGGDVGQSVRLARHAERDGNGGGALLVVGIDDELDARLLDDRRDRVDQGRRRRHDAGESPGADAGIDRREHVARFVVELAVEFQPDRRCRSLPAKPLPGIGQRDACRDAQPGTSMMEVERDSAGPALPMIRTGAIAE